MAKLFYPTLYAACLIVAAAQWTGRADWADLLAALDISAAWGQTPAGSSGVPTNYYPNTGFPSSGAQPPSAYPAGMPGAAPQAVSVPDSWPNSQARTNAPVNTVAPVGGQPTAPPGVTLPATVLPGNRSLPAPGQPGGAAGGAGAMPAGATSGQAIVPPLGGALAAKKPAGPAPVSTWLGSDVIARVGDETILAGEMLASINETIAINGAGMSEEEKDIVRERLVRKRLEDALQMKMIIVDARRKVKKEAFQQIDQKLAEIFEEKEVPKALIKTKLGSRAELDTKLREFGGSLEREKRTFRERAIAQDWVRQQVKHDEEVTHEQMLEFYQAHLTDYEFKARARWEEIVVRFEDFPSKAEAYQATAQVGTRVWAGERFADVARAASRGVSSADGGVRDWTNRGNLASETIDRALFTLPVGQLSPILEDTKSFQIVRVLEREDAGRKPFTEVQGDIRKQIKQQRHEGQVQKYVEDLKSRTKVWTIFDAPLQPEATPGTGLYAPAILNVQTLPPSTPAQPGALPTQSAPQSPTNAAQLPGAAQRR